MFLRPHTVGPFLTILSSCILGLTPDYPVDMFSAGIVLMELAAGGSIFTESTSLNVTLAAIERKFGVFGINLSYRINEKHPGTLKLYPSPQGTSIMRVGPPGIDKASFSLPISKKYLITTFRQIQDTSHLR